MREISNDELKKIQLDILIYFARFCDENNITYYLGGGTLLGAVRHKGFIPWDDDIDVMMPREDYERFIRSFSHDYYEVYDISTRNDYFEKHAKIYDLRTYVDNKAVRKKFTNEGVFIDLFPIDGLSNSNLYNRMLAFLVQTVASIHSATVLDYKASNRYNDRNAGVFNWKKHLRTSIKFLMVATIGNSNPKFWVRLLHYLLKRYEFSKSVFVAGLVSGIYGTREIMPMSAFVGNCTAEFEGNIFSVPSGYDYYLKRLYGNYMELPPVEKRQSHHDFKAYWK